MKNVYERVRRPMRKSVWEVSLEKFKSSIEKGVSLPIDAVTKLMSPLNSRSSTRTGAVLLRGAIYLPRRY